MSRLISANYTTVSTPPRKTIEPNGLKMLQPKTPTSWPTNISTATPDYSNTHIPNLQTIDHTSILSTPITDNTSKAEVLAKTFFPSPPVLPTIQDSIYFELLPARGIFTKCDIRNTIKKLKLKKAPGINGIKNQECVDTIIDNLSYIFMCHSQA